VSKIIAPFGDPIEARPPVPTLEERLEERERKRREKEERRRMRRAREEGEGMKEDNGVRGKEEEVAVREAREAKVA